MSKCHWKSDTDGLAGHRVAKNLMFVNPAVSAKRNQVEMEESEVRLHWKCCQGNVETGTCQGEVQGLAMFR